MPACFPRSEHMPRPLATPAPDDRSFWSLPVERDGGLKALAAFIQPYCPGGRLGNIVTAAHIQRGSVAYDDLSGVEFHG